MKRQVKNKPSCKSIYNVSGENPWLQEQLIEEIKQIPNEKLAFNQYSH
jgi:hypothetical protein